MNKILSLICFCFSLIFGSALAEASPPGIEKQLSATVKTELVAIAPETQSANLVTDEASMHVDPGIRSTMLASRMRYVSLLEAFTPINPGRILHIDPGNLAYSPGA